MDASPPPAPRLSKAFVPMPASPTRGRRLPMAALIATLVALLLVIAGAAALVYQATRPVDPGTKMAEFGRAAASARADLPPASVPPVEPVELLPVSEADARAINAAVPFTTEPVPAAAPLRLQLAAADQARAVDCLAAAAWYEAGDDAVGEQAVVQVVLNRMRHPAFPKTVCGVVFQGSERATGCQFSFTCDGALGRTASAVAWARAQGIATAALGGLVFRPVGYATHYHTDWVVPNWSSGVDKIASVHTHLFFRWRGRPGRPAAFTGSHIGAEPIIAKLARISPAHTGKPLVDDATLSASLADDGVTTAQSRIAPGGAPATTPSLRGNALARTDGSTGLFVIGIAAETPPGSLALVALDLCRARADKPCTVVGFAGAPAAVVTDGLRTSFPDRPPDFYYFTDRSRGRETVYWNCTRYPRPARQCLPPDFVALG